MKHIVEVDVIVEGRKVGVASVTVEVPDSLATRHAVRPLAVLAAAGKPSRDVDTSWYCMGSVALVGRT